MAGPGPPSRAGVYIGLGSNLGDRHRAIEAALARLEGHSSIELIRRTETVETPPWGVADQPPFLNAVAELRTTLAPADLLVVLKQVERDLGRKQGRPRWGPREIDLDILLDGELVMETPDLVVPHPRICERPFVLEQLVQLDDALVHPVHRVPLATYL